MGPETDKKTIRITLLGQTFLLRTPEDPKQVEELAAQIDSLMDGIAARTGDNDPARIAILACFHLADRLRVVQKQLDELRRAVETRSKYLTSMLDSALSG